MWIQSQNPAEDLRGREAVRVIAGAGLGMLFNAASLLVYTFGVFVRPIAQQSGWNRAYLASSIGPTTLVIGLLCPFAGRLVDRYGAHRFACISMPLLGLALLLMGSLPFSAASFAGIFLMAGILSSGQTPVAYTYVVSDRFDERRGLALGITLAFTGLGIALFPPLAAALISAYGWRKAYLLLGVLVFLIGVPAVLWLVPTSPHGRRGKLVTQIGTSLGSACATRAFWLLLVSFFLIATATGAGVVPLPAILADRGVEPRTAALIMSVIGFSMIAGRLVSGWLLDRTFAPWLAAAVFSAPMCGHLLLASGGGSVRAVIAALFLGVALGAETDALAYLSSRAFGIRHFGKIFGMLFCVLSAGTALGSAGLPALAAHFGRYAPANWLSAVCAATAVVLVANLRGADLPYGRSNGVQAV